LQYIKCYYFKVAQTIFAYFYFQFESTMLVIYIHISMINYKIKKYIKKININPKILYASRILHYVSYGDSSLDEIHMMMQGPA
jgi:hypothetical protein